MRTRAWAKKVIDIIDICLIERKRCACVKKAEQLLKAYLKDRKTR